jgi:hypothetical protein
MHRRTILHAGFALGLAALSSELFAATKIGRIQSTDILGA